MSAEKFILAVPSKGRLQENAAAFFARAGLDVQSGRGARDYRGALAGVNNVEIAFLPAADIVAQLGDGRIHMGVSGEDLARETLADCDKRVALVTPLGFGHANVVVAVPEAWIDVRSMFDLADVAAAFRVRHGQRMRVATKYFHLTRAYFADHGVIDYRIVESLGATEGAPAAGQAELIVDITSTGSTLRANALKILDDGVILRSEANLMASLQACWTPQTCETARAILSRIAAEEEARTTREITVSIPSLSDALLQNAAKEFCAHAKTGQDGVIAMNCPAKQAPHLAEWLIRQGADCVKISACDYIFTRENPLWEGLAKRLNVAAKKP